MATCITGNELSVIKTVSITEQSFQVGDDNRLRETVSEGQAFLPDVINYFINSFFLPFRQKKRFIS